jgi:hypothetical protein
MGQRALPVTIPASGALFLPKHRVGPVTQGGNLIGKSLEKANVIFQVAGPDTQSKETSEVGMGQLFITNPHQPVRF